MTRSRAIGETREEQLGFVSFALGQARRPAAASPLHPGTYPGTHPGPPGTP